MKITGPGRIETGKIKGAGRKNPAGGPSFADELGNVSGTEETSSTAASAPVAPLDRLFSLQEQEAGQRGRKEELERADTLLKLLEDIRRGLILGALTDAALKNVAKLLADRRQAFADPTLAPLVREIEVRAAVELAKRGL